MLTLDRLRISLLSDQPYSNLDELVRAELSVGRLTKQIRAELLELEDAVRAAPGFSQDAEEAIRDTIDALGGFCSPKHAYKNPPVLPSKEEIEQLTRWARVAFAVRCARRVLPLYLHSWPEGIAPYRIEVESLNDLDSLAGSPKPHEIFPRHRTIYGTVFLGMPDISASVASLLADLVLPILTPISQIDSVYNVARRSADLSSHLTDLKPVIRRDLDHLTRLSGWQHWTNDTPVPAEVFGPLWPEGPPDGWPVDADIQDRTDLPIELLSAARDLQQITENETIHVLRAINAYYIARTGVRLTMEDLRSLLPVGELAEV